MTNKTKKIMFTVIALVLVIVIVAGFLFMSNSYKSQIAKIQADSQKQINLLQSELDGKKITAYVPIRDIKAGEVITPDILEETTIFTDQSADSYLDINALTVGNEDLVEYDNSNSIDGYTAPDAGTSSEVESTETDISATVGMKTRETVIVGTADDTDIPEGSTDEAQVTSDEEIPTEDLEAIESGEATETETEKADVVTREPELSNVIAITDLPTGQPIFKSSVTIMDCDGLMEKYINFVTLNGNLLEGDTIDVRIIFPNGEDYIVTTKQVLRNLNLAAGEFYLWLTEEEITRLSAATVDASINNAELYITRYVKPAVQNENIATYQPNADVMTLMDSDPNIVSYAEGALSLTARRNLENRLKLFNEANDETVSNVSETQTTTAEN